MITMCILNFISLCFVKDQATHTILLMGKLKDGLNVFDNTQIALLHGPGLTYQSSSTS